jgi:hypothetical protein
MVGVCYSLGPVLISCLCSDLIAAALGTRTVEETRELVEQISSGSFISMTSATAQPLCQDCDSVSDDVSSSSNSRYNGGGNRCGSASDGVRRLGLVQFEQLT